MFTNGMVAGDEAASRIEGRAPEPGLGGGLKRFNPSILFGDRMGLTLYGMLAEAMLKGDSRHEERLYTKFVNHFPGEAKIRSAEQFRRLIDIIKSEGFDIRKPKQIHCNPAEHTIVNGLHRCAIATQLGIHDVPYGLRYQDGRENDEVFRRIFSPGEFEAISAKRDEYISKCDPLTQLKCNLRLHVWRNLPSYQAPFSSKPRTPTVRFYQGSEDLGLAGKRPTRRRLDAYGLCDYLDKSMDVLELGCNVGFVSMKLAGHVGHVDAVELDPNYITVAEMVKSYLKICNCDFHTSSFQEFRATKQYDLVVSTALHGSTGLRFDSYLGRVLELVRPGGLLLFESHEVEAELDWPLKRAVLTSNLDLLNSGIIDDVDTSMYGSEIREFLILRKRSEGRIGDLSLPPSAGTVSRNGSVDDGSVWDLPEQASMSNGTSRLSPRRLVKGAARRAIRVASRIVDRI